MKEARILIVEDEALMVEAIRRVLYSAGCEQTDDVSSGEEAVKLAARTNPDLILMDIHLAGKMDGIEAARSIHQDQNIPLIFLTGDSSDAVAELAKETGPWGYLTKPFSPQSLLNAIELALQKSREYTERTQQLIQAKSQSEETLADFFDNATELIQQVAPDGRLVYVNRAWRETLGYAASEISGLSLQDLIHPQDLPHCMDLFQRITTGEQARHVEVRFIKKDGGTVVLEGSSSCRFENGLPTLTRSIFHDVTERRRRQIQERIQADIRDAVWRMELDGDIKHVLLSLRDGLLELDIAFEECGVNVLERGADKELMHFFNLAREDDDVSLLTTDVAAHAGAQLVVGFAQNDEPTYRPDLAESDSYGERANFAGTNGESIRTLLDVPFTHGTLAVSSYVPNAFSSDDITTFERLAKVLSEGFRRRDDLRRIRESEARYRTLVETPNIGVFLVDFNCCYTYASPSVESLMGYAPDEFYSDPRISRRIMHPDDRVCELDIFRRARTGETIRDHELRLRHRDGNYRWFIGSIFPLANSLGAIDTLQIVIQDITKRKNAEARLEQLNRTLEDQVAEHTAALRQLSNAVEQTADMVMITDREGLIEYVNPAFEQLTGYKKEEILGKKPNVLNSGQHPPEFFAKLWQTIGAGQVYRGNIIDRTKTGEHFYAEKTITPLRNERGEITHFVSTDRDITYRVQAEKRQLQLEQSLIQSERGLCRHRRCGHCAQSQGLFAAYLDQCRILVYGIRRGRRSEGHHFYRYADEPDD